MRRKIMILYLLIITFLTAAGNLSSGEMKTYSTEKLTLKTDLPKQYSDLFLEYSESYMNVMYNFAAELRKDYSDWKAELTVYSDCREYAEFLRKKGSAHSPLVFQSEGKSWNRPVFSACYSSPKFFLSSFRHSAAEKIASGLPYSLRQSVSIYAENSIFIADDAYTVHQMNDLYLLRISEAKEIPRLSDFLKSGKKEWKKNREIYFAYGWALAVYIIDYSREGKNLFKTPEKISSIETDFRQWLGSLKFPAGYDHYQEYREKNVFSEKKKTLLLALEQNPESSIYHRALSDIHFGEQNWKESLYHAEKTLLYSFTDTGAVLNALKSSISLQDYRRAEYYLFLMNSWKKKFAEKEIAASAVSRWRARNPDAGSFGPEIIFWEK